MEPLYSVSQRVTVTEATGGLQVYQTSGIEIQPEWEEGPFPDPNPPTRRIDGLNENTTLEWSMTGLLDHL